MRLKNDPNFTGSRTKFSIIKDKPLRNIIDAQSHIGEEVSEVQVEDLLSCISAVVKSKKVLELTDLVEEIEEIILPLFKV